MAKALNETTARACHARPNDHSTRFGVAMSLNGGLYGHAHGFRAIAHYGSADGMDRRTVHPDDDPADYNVVSFLEMSGGFNLR